MTSQVCSRRGDLSQSRCDPGIPGLLKVPIWNQYLKRHVYGSGKWHSRCSGLETFHVLEPCFRTGLPKFTSLLWDEASTWNLHLNFGTCWNMILGSYETTKFLDVSLCAILAQAKVCSAVSWLRAFVCVSTPVSKVFTFLFCRGGWKPKGPWVFDWRSQRNGEASSACRWIYKEGKWQVFTFLFCRGRKNLWCVLRQRRHSPLVV